MSFLDYLGNTTADTTGPASPEQPSFLQSLGGAFGRSARAGGGLLGLASALSPSFASGFAPVKNTPSTAAPAPTMAPPPGSSPSGNLGTAGGMALAGKL